jgi:hypothetical protein
MKKTLNNATHIEGLIYDHALQIKVSGPNSKTPGTQFISGTVDVATDVACTNIVQVHYTYVTATTAKGDPNATYTTLANIINGTYKTIMSAGADSATRIRIDSAIGLNEFYSDRNGEEELVSVKRNEGGFAHTTGPFEDATPDKDKKRNTIDVDMVVTGVRRVEADEEKGTSEKVIIKGAIFDFRKNLLPVEFSVVDPRAMDYFEGANIDSKHPHFIHLKGNQVSETIVRRTVEEGAFGEPSVRETKNSRKDWVINWGDPYEWDSEDTMTVDELKEMMANREMTLAALKQRNEEYKASRANAGNALAASTTSVTAPVVGSFDF